jgi:hypothetical protein
MHFPRKRWRLALTAVLAALAVSVAFAAPALASEPGEWGSWSQELVSNGTQQVRTAGTLSEARNGGSLLEVWRGADNNQVWAAWNHGYPFSLGGSNTATYASPQVVGYGPNYFMVFHTGTDGNIYYAVVFDDNSWQGSWDQVPGQSTPNYMPVSVTQMGPGSYNLYMAYRSSTDDRVWGTRFNIASAGWTNTENVGGGLSPSAPSVTWNNQAQRVYIATRGEDNQVWEIGGFPLTTSAGENMVWYNWFGDGGGTIDTPGIAVTDTGRMMLDYRAADNRIWYQQQNQGGSPTGSWQADTTYWQTNFAVALVAVGVAIYALITGQDNENVYYKQAFNPT